MSTITRTEIERALEELGNILQSSFRLDEDGACFLAYKENLPLLLHYVEEDGRVILASEAKGGLENAPDSAWLSILSVDWLGIKARGCALSPDRDAGNILLWRDVNPTGINGERLQQAIEAFLEEVLAIREYLNAPDFAVETSASEIPAPSEAIIRG
jgi:hypothetical protein